MSIEDDTLSGAAVLTEKALNHLYALADKDYPSRDEFISFLKEECIKIIQSQKSMISLRNELSRVYRAAREGETLEKAQQNLKESVKERLTFLKRAETTIIEYGASLIKEGFTVLTHSRSSTVEKILLAAYKRTPFHLIATESRPNCEGRILAETLAQHNIPVTLIVDAAATLFDPDLVLVGADSVTSQYVINKIGTKFLALCFPTYVACSTNKFTTTPIAIEEKDPREVLEESHTNISVKNYYFDGTPIECIKGFITEYGILPSEKVKSLLQ
jgi:translation initiation factor 2B subunit (eIF-2B alpha/beta/delta family)